MESVPESESEGERLSMTAFKDLIHESRDISDGYYEEVVTVSDLQDYLLTKICELSETMKKTGLPSDLIKEQKEFLLNHSLIKEILEE